MSNSINVNKYNENAENRLILLYLLDKFKVGLTDLHITELLLENHLMDYFTFQFQLFGLIDTKLVTQRFTDEEHVLFSITPTGKDVLKNLSSTVPSGIRQNIDSLIDPMRSKIRSDNLITADFTPDDENSFSVTCSASEETFTLIKIDVQIGTRNDAIEVCHNWKKHSQEIYSEIIESLIKKRD